MRGTFARLDERMSQMETLLMAQEEKFKEQQINIDKAMESVLKSLSDNADSSKSTSKREELDEDDDNNNLSKKIEDLSVDVKRLRVDIGEMVAEKTVAHETSKALLKQAEKLVNSKLASSDEVIMKLEEKLSNFYVTGPISTPATVTRNSEWEEHIVDTLLEIKSNLNSLNNSKPVSTTSTNNGFDKEFFITIANETLEAIEDMKIEVLAASDKSFTKISTRIKEATSTLDGSVNEVLKTISDSATDAEERHEGITKSYIDLKADITALGKLEKILLESGDNVLSVKRGIEYSQHDIKLSIGDLITANSKEMNATLNKKYVWERDICIIYIINFFFVDLMPSMKPFQVIIMELWQI